MIHMTPQEIKRAIQRHYDTDIEMDNETENESYWNGISVILAVIAFLIGGTVSVYTLAIEVVRLIGN
jgi:hypothetical protein